MARHAHQLVERLRSLQRRRHDLTQAKDHVGAHTALDLAVSLVDPCDLGTLREALLYATNPASVPPIPVVLGPQDVAAIVGAAEIEGLLNAYGQAAMAWSSAHAAGRPSEDLSRATQRAWRAVMAAVEQLCAAVPPVELRGAPEGRPS